MAFLTNEDRVTDTAVLWAKILLSGTYAVARVRRGPSINNFVTGVGVGDLQKPLQPNDGECQHIEN